MTIVRNNLLTIPGYVPFCGRRGRCPGFWPRTKFTGKQFKCESCGWISDFEPEFMNEYKNKWNLANPHYADTSLLVSMMEII